jgi:putative nucleotidyltransferase with HDIG domain
MLSVDQFLDGVRDLPPAPRNLSHLLPLLDQADVEVTQVADIIQFDPALTAQVMRLCNSGYSGSASPATDICEATTRIGFEEIFQIVSALSTAALMRSWSKDRAQRADELWKHSVAAALIGKLIALEHGQKTALVFTACILHDIGKVALARGLEARYDDILTQAESGQTPVFIAERKALGFDHAEVGGRMLERWGFPQQIAAAARFHHEPVLAPEPHRPTAVYACLGNLIAYFMGYGFARATVVVKGQAEALELAGMAPDSIPRLMSRAFECLQDTRNRINLPL